MYSNRSGKTNTKIQDILDNEEVDYDTVLEFKKYFDSKRNNITLNESFKGKPHQDTDYIEWLLRGGEMGQKWVLKVVREQKLLKKF
jgi:hypothetical protein